MAGRNVDFVSTISGRCALSVNDANLPAPRGWVWVKLTDIARLESGHTPSRNHPEYWDGDISWIGIKDAREHHAGIIEDTFQHVTQAGIDNSAARLLPAKTVCLSRTASVGYVVVMGRPMATSQDFVNWVCTPALEPDYLKWLLLAEGEEGLRKFGKGSTHTTIYFPEVQAFHACVAPLNEQRRIAAKLDAIFEQTRAAKARLERLPALLEKLKRSILAAAFRGDLTKDWRAANPDVEPASVLLDRIRAERRRRWEEALRAKGKDPAKATYEEPQLGDSRDLPALPTGWRWTRADLVVAPGTIITYGIVLPGKHVPGGVPYVRQQDIQNGVIDVDALLRTTPEIAAKHDRSTLQAGDVLLCIIRHRRVAIVPAGIDGANITQGTVRFRPCVEIDGNYLAAWLESPVAQQWMETRVFGLDMPRINVSDTREIPIPLPPREEQKRIVELIAAAQARLTALWDAQAKAASLALGLEQAALAKAFRGELVPQDPADEPAAALLDRIRASRADEPAVRRRGRAGRLIEAAPAARKPTNGHVATNYDDTVDLVISAFQQGQLRLTATAITDTTGLDASAVKHALTALVDDGQVRIHGRARGTIYEWTA